MSILANDRTLPAPRKANTLCPWYAACLLAVSMSTDISQKLYAESVDFGIMFNETTMMIMRTVLPMGEIGIEFSINVVRKEISVEFPMNLVDPRANPSNPNTQKGKHDRKELFQFRIPFTQLKVIHQIAAEEDNLVLLVSIETPPKFFKQLAPDEIHDDKAVTWGDNDAWYRQTDILYAPNMLKKSPLTWRKANPILDLGMHRFLGMIYD